jgi:predicted alpha/beta-fold hydrolase
MQKSSSLVQFSPSRWLRNGHLMTITASLVRVPPRLPAYRERWELADGDFLDVDRLDGATPEAPAVLICHGLEGSSQAGYVLGVMEQAYSRGLAAVALNFRSCSGEPNRLPRFYHSGETSDLGYAIDRLLSEQPGRCLGLVGFSLGGNVVAKYLGERGAAVPDGIRAAAVISVPFDLARCCAAIDGPDLASYVYRERFLRRLRPKALAKARRFPGLIDEDRIRRARSLREFDDSVTAPLHGFAGAADYYARSSSGPLLPEVRRPLLVISAEDDPFVPGFTLPLRALRENSYVTAQVSAAGGHVGFLAGPPWALRRWAEEQAAEFIAAHLPVPPPAPR